MPSLNLPNNKIRISVFGRFRVEDSYGNEITPLGRKDQALLALIATDPHLKRSRLWLQDKLWSGVDQHKGAMSLRQSLAKIRKTFRTCDGAFSANNITASFDSSKVEVIWNSEDPDREFLQGMDVDDPEFENWHSMMRSRYEPSVDLETEMSAPPPIRTLRTQRTILVQPTHESLASLRLVEDQFIDTITRSIREIFSVDLLFDAPQETKPGTVILTVQAFEMRGTHLGLRTTLEEADTHHAIWSDSVLAEHAPGPISQSVDYMRLNHNLMVALSRVLASVVPTKLRDCDANLLAGMAVRKMFSMRIDALADADKLLVKASEIDARGVFQAWRAQLAAIQYVERAGPDRIELREKSQECSAFAMSADPLNSNVLCAIANANLVLDGNAIAAHELSKLSVEINAANPFAWWALANARLYSEDYDAAYDAAKRAQRLSQHSPFRFWSDFQVSLIAAVTGRLEEAVLFGELSAAMAPSFRPPLRYLTAFYSSGGDTASTQRVASRLKLLETDFSIDQMRCDTDYPVSLMRRQKLLNTDVLSEVEI